MGKMRYIVLMLALSLPVVVPPGKVYSLPNSEKCLVSSIVLQSDGKILIGGEFRTMGGVTRNNIARLHADGTLDTSFNAYASGSPGSSVSSIVLQPDGKILIGGEFRTIDGVIRKSIARLHADGTLDTSFNPNEIGSVSSIVLQSDGKILIGGEFRTVGGVIRNIIARLHADGTPDTSFNPNASGSPACYVSSIALQSDGKILIGGSFNTIGGITKYNIARLHANGTPDTSFASRNPYFYVSSIVLQPDGKILATMSGVTRSNMYRLHADGTPDTAFNPVEDLNDREEGIRRIKSGRL